LSPPENRGGKIFYMLIISIQGEEDFLYVKFNQHVKTLPPPVFRWDIKWEYDTPPKTPFNTPPYNRWGRFLNGNQN